MKRFSLLLGTFLIIASAQSQVNFDNRVKSSVRCADVTDFAYQMAPFYIKERQIDSLELLTTYWIEKCGSNEISNRINQLISISKGEIDQEWFSLSSFQSMIGIQNGYFNYYSHHNYDYYDERYLNQREPRGTIERLDFALKDWAAELIGYQEKCTDVYGLLLFQSGQVDAFFEWIKNPCDSNLQLATHYQSESIRFQKMWYTDVGAFIEIWTPHEGNITNLGSRGGLGFYVGEHHKRFYYSGTMILRFGNTPKPYQVVYKNNLLETDYYFGYYLGGDVGYAIAKTPNLGIYALGGLGYDAFDTFEPDEDDDDEPNEIISSFNLNSGIGFRQNVGQRTYVGIEGRYNWVKYDNPGGTNLEGNYVSIRLIVGGLTNYRKQRGIDALRASAYQKRK